MKLKVSAISSVSSVGAIAVVIAACSSSVTTTPPPDGGKPDVRVIVDSGPPPPPKCVDKDCLPGNKCLPDPKGKTSCQLPCDLQYGQPPSTGEANNPCPFNYTCTYLAADTPKSGVPARQICLADKNQLKNVAGVWGASCTPSGGITNNPACDSKQGFSCFARSPTDGQAYCTRSCSTDADCRGGWWCATVNDSPNATSNTRSVHKTSQICQPRNWCSECQSDVDCEHTSGGAIADGIPQHCIADTNGGHYCARECTEESQCGIDSTSSECITLDQQHYCKDGMGMTCVCAANPRECTGKGTLCDPCRSDADCTDMNGTGIPALCFPTVNAGQFGENFCAIPSGPKSPSCVYNMSTMSVTADCPTMDSAPNGKNVGCLTQPFLYDPANYCIGIVTFGIDPDTGQPVQIPGCWTPNR